MMIEEESVSDDSGNVTVTMSVADDVFLPVTMILKGSEGRLSLTVTYDEQLVKMKPGTYRVIKATDGNGKKLDSGAVLTIPERGGEVYLMKRINHEIVNTIYENVFRTLLNDCSELIIPVITEVFSECYRRNGNRISSPKILFLNHQDGKKVNRITNNSFTIVGEGDQKIYVYEFQNAVDSSILVKIYEYPAQAVLDQGEIIGNTIKVEIPRSAIVFFRSTPSTPDRMKTEITTQGGMVSFDTSVMKVQRYGINEIFEKNLLFLIPFYIFSHESRLEEYNHDKDKLETLKAEYADIMARLDQLLENGRISAYTRKIIMEMSDKVLENIAQKFEHIREGVKSVMGGKVLEHEAEAILREGWKQGREEGRRKGESYGRMRQAKETAFNLRTIGLEEETIAKMVNVQVSAIREWFGEVDS